MVQLKSWEGVAKSSGTIFYCDCGLSACLSSCMIFVKIIIFLMLRGISQSWQILLFLCGLCVVYTCIFLYIEKLSKGRWGTRRRISCPLSKPFF